MRTKIIPAIAQAHIPRLVQISPLVCGIPAACAENIAVALSTITLLTYTKATEQAATAMWHSIIAVTCIQNGRRVLSIQRICFICRYFLWQAS